VTIPSHRDSRHARDRHHPANADVDQISTDDLAGLQAFLSAHG
jgi:hypothetical protein